jgi:hypothetical protein
MRRFPRSWRNRKGAVVRRKDEIVYPELTVPDPAQFLDCLESAVRASAEWRLLRNQAPFAGVVAEYRGPSFSGSGLALCAYHYESDDENASDRTVVFGPIADHWEQHRSVSQSITSAGVNAAFGLFRSLVRATARTLGIACRIRYPRDRKAYPLSPMAAKLLRGFCILANTSCLHPCDWERFFRFIRFCHAHRVELTEGRLIVELRSRRIPDQLARTLADRYDFGRSLLKGQTQWLREHRRARDWPAANDLER